MRVTVQHSQYFEWEPIPPGVVVTEADVAAGRVRPVARPVPGTDRLFHGNWTMRVAHARPTHTEAHIPETALFHAAFHRDVRAMRPTRQQALALHLTRYVFPERMPVSSIVGVEVHDDGPHEATHAGLLDEHVSAGNIDGAERQEFLDRLLAHHTDHAAANAEHLERHFRVKKAATS